MDHLMGAGQSIGRDMIKAAHRQGKAMSRKIDQLEILVELANV